MESKYTCLIIDEKAADHDILKAFLLCWSNLKFMKSCFNVEEAIIELNEHHYDIVFFDVSLSNGASIDLIAKLNKKPTIIITSDDTSFAFEAYENDAVDYLLKPIIKSRFARAIRKALTYSKERRKEKKKYIELKIDGLATKIDQEEIIYIRSMVNHSKYYLVNRAKPIVINEAFSKQLPKLNADLFLQSHRTCIVNVKFVIGKKEKELILSNKVYLPIGRKYFPGLQSLLMQLD
jgi:DNA-binding LytR/AlgR family response regulator